MPFQDDCSFRKYFFKKNPQILRVAFQYCPSRPQSSQCAYRYIYPDLRPIDFSKQLCQSEHRSILFQAFAVDLSVFCFLGVYEDEKAPEDICFFSSFVILSGFPERSSAVFFREGFYLWPPVGGAKGKLHIPAS